MTLQQSTLNDKLIIATFCTLAAIRVFIYAAAFPFFGNIDEQAHLDLVVKYSEGHIPSSLEKLSPNSAYYIPRYESAEYFNRPTEPDGKNFAPPPWKRGSEEKMQRYYNEGVAYWSNNYTNHESSQAPVYYATAAAWMNMGSFAGMKEGLLLYWIRFMNVLLIVVLVIVAYHVAKSLYPASRFLVIGLPMLVAFFPQDSFYSIQNDVLSPVVFGISLITLIRFLKSKGQNLKAAALTGLLLALTVLVKIANLPLVIVATGAVFLATPESIRNIKGRAAPILLFLSCLLLPLAIWFQWNMTKYGDLTASEQKIAVLGWTHKHFIDWFNHPIFSFRGFWIFISGLLSTFWRGELIWWNEPLAMPAADLFYILTSIGFVLLALFNFRKTNNSLQNKIHLISFFSFAALVFFMFILSICFDFGKCENPSQAHPYFTSGRLITGALIPFLLLYLQGLDVALSRIKNETYKLYVLGVIVLFITLSELIVNLPVFSSQYNFFHL
jgi:hypothetical protein